MVADFPRRLDQTFGVFLKRYATQGSGWTDRMRPESRSRALKFREARRAVLGFLTPDLHQVGGAARDLSVTSVELAN